MLFWLFLFFPFCLQAQRLLKAGVYHDLKPKEALVLDTGSFIFIGLEMKGLGKGIWLDGRKATHLTVLNSYFEGKNAGTALATNSNATIVNCYFNNLEYGIYAQGGRRNPTHPYTTIRSNTFVDNQTSIYLAKDTFQLALKCNTFIHSVDTIDPVYRKGLVIGEGARIRYLQNGLPVNNSIGGPADFNSGAAYPNANVWPTAQGVNRSIRPKVGQVEQDLHNPVTGWPNSPYWMAIENQSNVSVSYWRYDNEFVGWGSNSISGLATFPVPNPVRKVRTFGQTLFPPSDPNYVDPSDPSYDEACGTDIDQQPILFPARIAIIDSSSVFTSIKTANFENQMLGDAVPNPARNQSKIGILLPGDIQQAVLQIVDFGTGKVLQSIAISERGKLEVTLDLTKSPSGIYGYRLLVDGKPIGTRKLAVVK